jgi:hypothetical protein
MLDFLDDDEQELLSSVRPSKSLSVFSSFIEPHLKKFDNLSIELKGNQLFVENVRGKAQMDEITKVVKSIDLVPKMTING